MVDARLHPADVVAHDEQDVGLLRERRLCGRLRMGRCDASKTRRRR